MFFLFFYKKLEKYGKIINGFITCKVGIKMINFVIVEDETILLNKYKKEIDNFMMNYDIEYKVHRYNGYTNKWKEYAQIEDGFKIYLLDIKTEHGSGLDAARLLREQYDDWNSMIIIITSYPQYRYEAFGKRLMLIDFINKLDNCEKQLKDSLLICMKHYDRRPKVLRYTYKNIIYNLEYRQILYIEKELDSKKCKITTIHGEYYIQGTINHVMTLLDDRFVKCSRSSIVNLEQIDNYNIKENVITFKNQDTLDTISRDKRKEIIDYVRGVR